MINILNNVDFCLFQENQILFLILFTVVFKGAKSGDIFAAFPKRIPVSQAKAVIFIISKLFGNLE